MRQTPPNAVALAEPSPELINRAAERRFNEDNTRELTPPELEDVDLGTDERVHIQALLDTDGPHNGSPLLDGNERVAIHETVESALAFIDDLHDDPTEAIPGVTVAEDEGVHITVTIQATSSSSL